MSEVGDDVRERSPLHELGEREWPVEGGRDRFRIRVRRNLSSKGPTVNRAKPVRVLNPVAQPKPTKQRVNNPSKSSNPSNPSSPDCTRRPTPGSPNLGRNKTFLQRPSRLPVVSVYNPKPFSPSSIQHTELKPNRPTNKYTLEPGSSIGLPSSSSPSTSLPAICSIIGDSDQVAVSPMDTSTLRQYISSSRPDRRVSSPKRGDVTRRVPSPILNSYRRSPSVSRPSSPGQLAGRPTSPGRRGSRPPSPSRRSSRPPSPKHSLRRHPSPSQLDPHQAEALRMRIGRLRTVRLYLLQQVGSNSFLVAGTDQTSSKDQSSRDQNFRDPSSKESRDQTQLKYKVNIGPQTCSCLKGPGCLHLLFIMLKVFKIGENDSRLTAKVLKEYEIESLFRDYQERQHIRVLRSRQQSLENLEDRERRREEEEDAMCPICLSEMYELEEQSTCFSCHNNLHRCCMSVWIDECKGQGETVLCPLCRSPWDSQVKPVSNPVYHHFTPSPYTAPSQYSAPSAQYSAPKPRNLSLSSGYSTISRTSDTLHMIEQGGSPEDIPLPKAEPIPQQHWHLASSWIQLYGRDLVSCLFSRDWLKRETGLRRLAREVVKILQHGSGEYTEKMERSWKCCVEILQLLLEDKVYKVYLAAVKTLRALLNFLNCKDETQFQQIKTQIRPLLHCILIKCADGNRRISEVSTETLLEISRGHEADFAIGKHASLNISYCGLDLLLHLVLEEREVHSVSWQCIMGRLVLLNRMLEILPQEFSLENKNAHTNFNRLMMIIDFSFQNLSSTHTNVSKLAKKVFTLAARNTVADNTTFNQVWELLGALDSTLEMRMKKNITSAVEELYLGEARSQCSSVTVSTGSQNLLDRSMFLENFLNECSNQHTEQNICKSIPGKRKGWRPPLLRSTSHSPSRQQVRSSSQSPSRFLSQSPARNLSKPLIKNSFCQSAYNVNLQSKRPSYLPLNKPRVLSRLAQKSKIQDLARDVLPKFDLSFLSGSPEDMDLGEEVLEILHPTKPTRPTPSRQESTGKPGRGDGSCRSPPVYRARGSKDSGLGSRTPLSSPLLREKRSGSCKDLVDYEENLALALALSRSINHETPLPHIPGLSQKITQDVLAHPHKQILEGGEEKRSYLEGRDWTKGRVLGTGAFSTCYQARDVETGTIMAAKQISFCRNSEEEQEKVEELVREEVTLMSRLQHPHTVRMYGAIQEGSHVNVFEEWMPGGSISSLLDRHGPFTEQVTLRYTHQILLGLEYLHANGVLHRDLKGANLLVDTSGHQLRIADFGAAARMLSGFTIPGEFQGELQGTVAFMAPEVLRGDSYGRACDIWSLGCTIIEMATGKPPWGEHQVSNRFALIFRIACADGPPDVPTTLSPPLRDLTLRCLELEPSLRPTARELLLHPVFIQLT